MENIIFGDFIFDLSDVTIEDLKKQYVDYNFRGLITDNNDYESMIVEAEEHKYSVDLNLVRNQLIRKYNLYDFQFSIETGSHGIKYAILIANVESNFKMIKEDFKHFGYYFSYVKEVNLYGMKWLALQFEPMYQDCRNDIIKSMTYIYHLTPYYNVESIKKNGLVPKSTNYKFNYPDRIFFIKEDTSIPIIKKLAKRLSDANKDFLNIGKYYLITLNTHLIPEHIKFYLDPLYDYGLFCEEPVPSSAIVDITEFKF